MKEITLQNLPNAVSAPASKAGRVEEEQAGGFGQMLKDSMAKVNSLHLEADQAIQDLAAGKATDIHKTMIAMEKAEVSFQLMMQVRNKVVAAYQEIMRMQV